jgi:hypothetical protein
MAVALVEGTFQGTGVSTTVPLHHKYNVSVDGTFSATVALERSFDLGNTWLRIEEFSAPTQRIGEEPEAYVMYRLACTDHGSGQVKYRLSQ